MTKNKHRFISLLLAAAMILSLLPVGTFAADVVDSGECGENVTWTLDSDGLLTISGTGEMENYSRFGVLSPFKDDQDIKYVVIEDGVTSIGIAAFDSCTDLTGVIVPGSIMIISEGAFYGCSGLKSVTLPDTLKLIEYYAFYDCTSLTSITIPGGVTGIEDCAFENCTNIKDVYYPGTEDQWNEIYIAGGNSCLETAEKHFNSAPASDPVTDPVQPGKIIDSGTCGENLTWTLDADGLLTISGIGVLSNYGDELPFDGNNLVKSVVIEDGVTAIAAETFRDCTGIESVTIPNSVAEIGDCAFIGCTALSDISFPESVTFVGVDTISDTVFYNDSSNWTDNVLYIGNHLIAADPEIHGDYTVKDGTRYIAAGAFSDCAGLKSVTIPAGVTRIERSVFYGCSGLENVTVPDGVTSIGASAFSGCASLKSIALPDSVTSIECGVFLDCSGLTSITIPAGVTDIDGDMMFGGTFSGCSALTSVTIPASVTRIGYSAFKKCDSLADIYYAGTEEQWNAIDVIEGNDCLAKAEKHFNYVPASDPVTGPTTEPPATNAIFSFSDEGITCKETEKSLIYASGTALTKSQLAEAMTVHFDYAVITVEKDGFPVVDDAPLGTGARFYVYLSEADEIAVSKTIILMGDVDGDATVNATDARLALRAAAKLDALEGAFGSAADVDGDYNINATDARGILRAAAKLDALKIS
ncbi:MAG: leucine-rich repeat protein [Clostridiales bacterium]|nr:leucine-rich repeat protein [Clostridiales bacterium]